MPVSPHIPENLDRIESENRRKYSGAFYKPESIMGVSGRDKCDYFSVLQARKLGLVQKYMPADTPLLDLCCATGEHLFHFADSRSFCVGLDFTLPFVQQAVAYLKNHDNLQADFLCGDAKALPFPDETFGLIFSFSSLYTIPRVQSVLQEISRTLNSSGVAIVDFGNLWSINTLVSLAHSQTAHPLHYSISNLKKMLSDASLEIHEHHAFQILPFWGNKPRWLRPLLHPVWKKILQKQWRGKMLDEWICSLPGFRNFAFRHIFVCRRKRK